MTEILGPPSQGIWRLHLGEWVRIEVVECNRRVLPSRPPKTHGAALGAARTLCGAKVGWRTGARDTDTPSEIQCKTCQDVLARLL